MEGYILEIHIFFPDGKDYKFLLLIYLHTLICMCVCVLNKKIDILNNEKRSFSKDERILTWLF